MNTSFRYTVLTLSLYMGAASAQTVDHATHIQRITPAIDSIYQAFAEAYHSPGLAYAVVYDGRVLHSNTIGLADLQQQTPVSPQTVFRIASMTKSFVAAAILKLRDAGKLQLDDPVAKYLPALGAQKLLTADAPQPTIRHLLTHTAGFPEDNPWGDRQLDIADDAFQALIDQGFSFSNAPGVQYEYSNTGYALLGEVIRQVSGQRYDTYINTQLLEPLGMTHTYWEYTEVPDRLLANGYRWVNGEWVPQPLLHDGAYGAMGGLMSSLDDFAKYTTWFLDAWPPRDGVEQGPLARASLREMQQPWTFNTLSAGETAAGNPCAVAHAYGYGLRWTHDCTGVTTVGHSGGLPGFGSNWTILPDYGLGVICFSNVTYAPTTAINAEVVSAIIRQAGLTPRQAAVSAILKQRQGELMEYLPDWDGAEGSTAFADNFFLDNYIDQLRVESQALFRTAGNILRVNEIVAENNLRGAFLIECEQGDIIVHFTLSPEREPRIQQLSMRLAADDR